MMQNVFILCLSLSRKSDLRLWEPWTRENTETLASLNQKEVQFELGFKKKKQDENGRARKKV